MSEQHHTLVLSDIHLSDAEIPSPDAPLWKRYKQRDLFIDESFSRFLDHMCGEVGPNSELVLNGDVFDFDAVLALPRHPDFPISWLERRRGLSAEEPKSRFKMRAILDDHPVFLGALRRWIAAGHRLIFVIGNHDIELHWGAVRNELCQALDLPASSEGALRICEWFYLSGGDTLVEHGNQLDPYCLCADPISPTIRWGGTERVRVPFGNLAERYILNAMGLFNPHVESSFIRPLREYMRFYFRYLVRTQPLLGWTWLWGAVATLVVSLREGFLPAVKDPTHLDERVAAIGERANSDPRTVRTLQALHVHPAIFSPWKIMRELWLDRALLLTLLLLGSFQAATVLGFLSVSPWGGVLLGAVLLAPFIFYARSVNSDVDKTEQTMRQRLPLELSAVGMRRAVVGHTHLERHYRIADREVINTGTWSPAYQDVECTVPHGRKCFAWIRPDGEGRVGGLYEWKDPGFEEIGER